MMRSCPKDRLYDVASHVFQSHLVNSCYRENNKLPLANTSVFLSVKLRSEYKYAY